MRGSKGGRGAGVLDHPPEQSQSYRVKCQVLSNTGLDSLKKSQSYQAGIRHSMLGQPMMASFSGIWILSPLINKKK